MSTVTTTILNQETARKGLLVARAYSHPVRIKMLELLAKNGRMCVSQFYDDNESIKHIGERLEQSITSQHLAILRKSGLVKTQKEGKNVWYELSENIATANDNVIKLGELLKAA